MKLYSSLLALLLLFTNTTYKASVNDKSNQQTDNEVSFTLNGTPVNLTEGGLTRFSNLFNTKINQFDTSQVTLVQFMAQNNTRSASDFMSIRLDAASEEGFKVNTTYTKNVHFSVQTFGPKGEILISGSDKNMQLTFSEVSNTHFKGSFSGKIGLYEDSTITNGNFDIIYKR